jgi:phosphatidylserine decarboxylase
MTEASRTAGARRWTGGLNFFLTNRIPRRFLTRLMGWFSHIESPFLARGSIAVWRLFSDLDLSDSRLDRFPSLHACFTRELKAGARSIDRDPRVLVSPCDGIVIACGPVEDDRLIQVKGSWYTLGDLLLDMGSVELYRGGQYVTLRLTPTMYHRFHAPFDCTVEHVTYVPGEVWNVNPPTLERIPGLYCRNERAIIRTTLEGSGQAVTLIAVAAILVAGIRLRFLDLLMDSRYHGETQIPCRALLGKGDEMGWFEHGSTIIVLAPKAIALCDDVHDGARVFMGQPLMRLPHTEQAS